MLLNQFQRHGSNQMWLLQTHSPIPIQRKKIQRQWIEPSSLCKSSFKLLHGENKLQFQQIHGSYFQRNLSSEFFRMRQINSCSILSSKRRTTKCKLQDGEAKLLIESISSYCLYRLIQSNFASTFIKMARKLIPLLKQTSGTTSLCFACISNSLNKPTPLKLDVSLPSFDDIRWNMARLLYLLNIQLERNVATFFVVLLVACFSFVLIGGFLFFKFRGSTHSLEDCLWEAWACLCSSSTHLKQRTRVERVLGFILAIWGILFYSRLLSTMTEEFRVNPWDKYPLKTHYLFEWKRMNSSLDFGQNMS